MSANIHMTKERYDELMAKRKAERMSASPSANAEPSSRPEMAFRPYSPKNPRKPPVVGRHGEMSRTEERFLADILHGEARFEAVTLKLEGGSRYTPDFVTREDGVTTFYEVKGSYRLGSQGRAHTAFLEAASQFPWCRFVWAAAGKNGTWDMRTVDPIA